MNPFEECLKLDRCFLSRIYGDERFESAVRTITGPPAARATGTVWENAAMEDFFFR